MLRMATRRKFQIDEVHAFVLKKTLRTFAGEGVGLRSN